MGLAASQARYLTLSARKNDLEYAAQTISSRRLQLAYKTADLARRYSDGMNNKAIMIQYSEDAGDGNCLHTWEKLDFTNLLKHDLVLWGTDGKPISLSVNVANKQEPYIYYLANKDDTYDESSPITKMPLPELSDADKTAGKHYVLRENPLYMKDLSGGKDIQSLLVSGRAQVITTQFAEFLASHMDNDGNFTLDGKLVSFNDMQTAWQKEDKNRITGLDWRSDITSTLKQRYYTEDDEAVQAQYEQETAEIQAQDKQLELEIKNIETQHKAIETELDSVQKVIQGNIEKTFKIFS